MFALTIAIMLVASTSTTKVKAQTEYTNPWDCYVYCLWNPNKMCTITYVGQGYHIDCAYSEVGNVQQPGN